MTSFLALGASDLSPEDAFTKIYKNQMWGPGSNGLGSSGGGSALETTIEYRLFLEKFLKKNNNYLKYIYSYFIRIKGLGAIHLLISILKRSGFWLLVRSYKKAIKDFKKEGI